MDAVHNRKHHDSGPSTGGPYHFLASFLTPGFTGPQIQEGNYTMIQRRWQTSSFDYATLGSAHRLHLAYQLMEVLSSRCNVEFKVEGCTDIKEATTQMRCLRLMLCAFGVSPFFIPVCTTHSINAYTGINSRDSEFLRSKLEPDLRTGPTSKEIKVEAWMVDVTLVCLAKASRLALNEETFRKAAQAAKQWMELEREQPRLAAFRAILETALCAPSFGQGVLFSWVAIESLFPEIQVESSHRLALHLAALANNPEAKGIYETARNSYKWRSAVAHGRPNGVDAVQWWDTWSLAMTACRSILDRRGMPTVQTLEQEILGRLGSRAAESREL